MANPFAAALAVQRPAYAPTGGGSSYQGAVASRLTADWILASIKSADQEVEGDQRTLRARARELVRNNDTAARYVSLVDEQTLGHEGIRFQAQVTRPDGMLDMGINDRIEAAFEDWAQPENCTVDGRMGFVDVLSSWARTEPQDGEWLVRLLPFRGNRFGFALQIIDPDQLDTEYNRAPSSGLNEIRMGVEIDRWTRPVAYWIWDHHPSDYTARGRERQRITADQIVHLYRIGRAGQTRGVPWFAPALLKLRMIGGYEEAEVVAARMAACKGGFLEQAPESVADPNAPQGGAKARVAFEIEPGQIDKLPAGWTFKAWDPQHPTAAFADFHKAMVRGIAAGLSVSYVSLANDLSDVNFSSIRAGLLNERDVWRKLQHRLIRHFCRRVYRQWLKWSLSVGALELPSRNVARWDAHRWQPRGWPWVDPLKDLQAGALGVKMGVNTLTRIAAQEGLDFEELMVERRYELLLAQKLGVPISTDTSTRSARNRNGNGNGEPASGDDDDELNAALLRRVSQSRALTRIRPNMVEAALNGNGRGS